MDPNTPIVLAAAKYPNRDLAVEDFDRVWSARKQGEFDHTAVAVLTKDAKVQDADPLAAVIRDQPMNVGDEHAEYQKDRASRRAALSDAWKGPAPANAEAA